MKQWKQRLIALLFAVVMAAMPVLETVHASGGQMAGDGTAENPYIIMDAEDLRAIDEEPSACYVLGADIAPGTWTAPITTTIFSGTLDGNGYTIALPEGATASLLSVISGTVRNLNLYAPKVTLNKIGAGLMMSAASIYSSLTGTIENCSVVGNLEVTATGASIYAGGFVPYIGSKGKISGSYAAVTITKTGTGGGTKYYAGALAGYTAASSYSIADSYWDTSRMEVSAGAYASGGDSLNQAEGKTTEEMKQSSFAELLNEKNSGKAGVPWQVKESYDGYPALSSHAAVFAENTAASISGECISGKVLTASDNDSSTQPRTYEWYRVGASGETKIEGASGSTYILTDTDIGYRIKTVVAAENMIGERTARTGIVKGSSEYSVQFQTTPSDAKLVIMNSAGYIVSTEKNMTLSNGIYYYSIGKDGYQAKSGTIKVNGTGVTETVSLAKGNMTGYTWSETYNMGVTTDPVLAEGLPKGVTEEVYTKWDTCIGLWQGYEKGEVSNPVFLNDFIYITGEMKIKKVDPATGKVVKEADLTYGTGYNYFFQTAGDKLVVQEHTVLECFDADLNRLWITEDMELGEQGLCPLNYADGMIYGGTVSPGGYTACYFAVSAADGRIIWKQEPELIFCGSKGNYTGYYWTGAAVIGDYLVYGGEGGRVYSTNRWTGEIVDRYDICNDASYSIRSSVSYDGNSVYFTDTYGDLYQVAYNKAAGTFGIGKRTLVGEQQGADGFGSTCTATPVIYNNRLYIGDASCLAVFDTTDLSLVYRVNHSYGTLRDLRLVADTQNNCVYVFTSYYKSPGSVVMLKDAPGQTSGELVDFSSLTTGWVQYNASMPIFGSDGTIYFTNDLGYLVAIGKSEAWLTVMEGNGTLDNALNNGISEYELVVAPGTKKAVLTLEVNDGSSLTVNGDPVVLTDNKGTASVPLEDKQAVAVIRVVKGSSVRTYTVNVREASQKAGLEAYLVNQSNSLSSGKTLEELSNQVYICYGQSSTFMRLWLKPEDANAVQAVYAIQGVGAKSSVDAETGLVGNSVLGTGTGTGYTRWNLYWDGTVIAVKAIITAEDGVTAQQRSFIITRESKADFENNEAGQELIVRLQNDNAVFEMENYKSAAVSEINGYLDMQDYRAAQQQEITGIIEQCAQAIQAAADMEAVDEALSAAKKALDEVKTNAVLTEEELATAKSDASEKLESYLNLELYRREQKEEIAAICRDYGIKIAAASSVDAVNALLTEAKEKLDAVKTDAQLTAEEAKKEEQKVQPGTSGNAPSPKTGIEENIGNILIMLLCSMTGLGIVMIKKRARR